MFNNTGTPSVADIAAVTGGRRDGDGFGDGNGWWVLIILFALFGGWGGNGWGGNGATQGALTRGDLCMDMNFNDVQNGVRGISDSVNTGFANLNSTICHQQYDTAQLINGVQTQIGNEFRGVDNAICTLGYNTQAGFNALATQFAQCCCEQKAEAAQTRYDMAQGFASVNQNLEKQFCQLKMEQKDAQIAAMQNDLNIANLKASQEAQTREIVNTVRPCPEPAYITCNPWTTNGTSYNGCSCGTGYNCAA